MKKIIRSIAIVLLLAGVSGCVTRSITKNETRVKVSFASAMAAQVFYDAYLARNHPNPINSTNAVVNNIWVSFRLPYWQYHNVSENVRFNRAVAAADTDHDGLISEAEAQAYAATPAHGVHH